MTIVFTILLVITSCLLILLVLLHKGAVAACPTCSAAVCPARLGGSSVAERNLDRITIGVGVHLVRLRRRPGPALQAYVD